MGINDSERNDSASGDSEVAALFHACAPCPLGTQVLRHASARSDESYILESAELTAVAAALRMPPPGRPSGQVMLRLGNGPTDPRGAAGATPCRSPSGRRPRSRPPPPLLGSGRGAAA